MNNKRRIGLAELCAHVKRELLEPEAAGDGDAPILSVEEVELELQVVAAREGKAGIKLYVLELGGGEKLDELQKVKVKLKPLLSREERLAILKARHPHEWEEAQRRGLGLFKGEKEGALGEDFDSPGGET